MTSTTVSRLTVECGLSMPDQADLAYRSDDLSLPGVER